MKRPFKIWRNLISLRLTITLLLIIALLSTIGSIIPQDETIEFYKNNYSSTFIFNWRVILFVGIDHIYSTWWFISLLILFGFNLIMCTFLQQLPNLKFFKRCYFYFGYTKFKSLEYYHKLKFNNFTKCISLLKGQNYVVFQTHSSIYSHKGLIGRISPIIVHISLLFILAGSFYNSIVGFTGQEIFIKNETAHIQNTLNIGRISLLPKISTRINDFWITYNKKQKIKQFYSNLSVINDTGFENQQKTISVNKPLNSKNLVYYQTDWGALSLRFLFGNEIIQIPVQTIKQKQWLSLLWNNKLEIFPFILSRGNGTIEVYDQLNKKLNLLEMTSFINNIYFFDILFTTGLQVKLDAGIRLVYFGFFLLMISGLFSYLTFSQVWILNTGFYKFIGGKTNRAKFNFKVTYSNLIKFLYSQ